MAIPIKRAEKRVASKEQKKRLNAMKHSTATFMHALNFRAGAVTLLKGGVQSEAKK